jgi:hypothetical protein
MRLFLCTFFIGLIWSQSSNAQIPGCMDPASSNYNPLATISDGSCIYPDGNVPLKSLKKATLPNTISEISGMVFINSKLYGHNDSGGQPAIYEIDTTNGTINKTITLLGVTNVDWEDITQDDHYVYIGDFGNNEAGNRTDLKIYRFPKSDIDNINGATGNVPSSDIATINFRYEDQVDFTQSQPNSTRFDCESIIYDNGQLHLFTKNWLGNYTVHYVLSASPVADTQVAIRKDSFNTQGTLITSAAKINDQTIALLGYEVAGYPSGSLLIISGFSDMDHLFTTGNKRKVDLGKIVDVLGGGGIGQIEGLALAGTERVLISNELFSREVSGFTFTVLQNLYGLNISAWLPKVIVLPIDIYDFSAKVNENNVLLRWKIASMGASHYDIEMSNDSNLFLTIGRVENNSAGGQFSYSDDQDFLVAAKFYRIKMVMKDGHYTYSKIISVKRNSRNRLNLEASSFSDKIKFSFYSDKEEELQLGLIDMYGRILVKKKLACTTGNNSFEIDNLSSFSKAVYFVTAKTNNALVVKKVMKN